MAHSSAPSLYRGLYGLVLAATPLALASLPARAQEAPATMAARNNLKVLSVRLQPRDLAVTNPAVLAGAVPGPMPSTLASVYTVAVDGVDRAQLQRSLRTILGNQRAIAIPEIVRQTSANQPAADFLQFVLPGESLRFSAANNRFEGSLQVGVVAIDQSYQSRALPFPITFQVLETALAQPAVVQVDHTSPPHQTIAIHSADVSNPFVLHVASNLAPGGTPVTLPLMPTLRLDIDRQVIQGLGLETARLNLSLLGVDNPAGRKAMLGNNVSAFIEPTTVEFGSDGTATALLRSSGTGTATVTASIVGLSNASRDIRLDFPWRTFAASTLGGLGGGVLRLSTRVRRGKWLGKAVLGLVVSILAGMLVFGLAVLGINLLPIIFAVTVGDLYVLIISAIGGWLGTSALKRLV